MCCLKSVRADCFIKQSGNLAKVRGDSWWQLYLTIEYACQVCIVLSEVFGDDSGLQPVQDVLTLVSVSGVMLTEVV